MQESIEFGESKSLCLDVGLGAMARGSSAAPARIAGAGRCVGKRRTRYGADQMFATAVIALAASASIAQASVIQFSTTGETADYNQNTTTLNVTQAVDGNVSQTSSGWAVVGHYDNTLPGGSGFGGDIAVFPLSTPTDSGSNGTNLTFNLYQLLSSLRIGEFEIEVTTSSNPSVAINGHVVTGTFTPVAIESVVSGLGTTNFSIDADANVVTASSAVAEKSGLTDIYEISASTTLTGITGVELISYYSENSSGSLQAGYGDGVGLDSTNFVLTQITGTATAVPEPASLGVSLLSALLLLRRRRRLELDGRQRMVTGDDARDATLPNVTV